MVTSQRPTEKMWTSQFILPQKYEVVSYLSQQAGPVVLISMFRQTTKLSFLWTSEGNSKKISMPKVILSKPVQVCWIHAAKSCSFLLSVDSRLTMVLLTFPLLLTATGAIFFLPLCSFSHSLSIAISSTAYTLKNTKTNKTPTKNHKEDILCNLTAGNKQNQYQAIRSFQDTSHQKTTVEVLC